MIFNSYYFLNFPAIAVGTTILEDFATGLPNHVYPIFDLYGKCEKISIISGELKNNNSMQESISALNNTEIDNSLPQCEKADLEIHEKETDIPTEPVASTTSMLVT